MANTEMMRKVADWIDVHPQHYTYEWSKCVAGRTVRMDGARFIELNLLRPKRDDDPRDVHDYNGHRYIVVSDRAARLLDIESYSRAAADLFYDMPGVVNKHDAHQVAAFVRRYANYLDADTGVEYLDW